MKEKQKNKEIKIQNLLLLPYINGHGREEE